MTWLYHWSAIGVAVLGLIGVWIAYRLLDQLLWPRFVAAWAKATDGIAMLSRGLARRQGRFLLRSLVNDQRELSHPSPPSPTDWGMDHDGGPTGDICNC